MVYLMHGFVGSGKSTRARQLEQAIHAVRFTPDEWMTLLFGFDPPADKFAEHLAAILELAQPLCVFEWVRMETPIEECRARNRQRHETGSGLLAITDATFDTLLQRFEPFNDEEIRRMRISDPT